MSGFIIVFMRLTRFAATPCATAADRAAATVAAVAAVDRIGIVCFFVIDNDIRAEAARRAARTAWQAAGVTVRPGGTGPPQGK